ncbi:MAG: homocysteine S-methyltransferase family protein [Rhodospirillales bacterium]|jgi:S-methylmethionine-dependent homocysteine/selenocysteine methylase|nr:homocysteine S-methyltransferase family protein [Rhodospirillales bacterium]
MAKYRTDLPQASGRVFLSDGGLETTLIFHDGFELPCFEAFTLLDSDEGMAALRAYYRRYALMARTRGMGFLLETPTWRANPDWGAKVGYSAVALADVNWRAVDLMLEIRSEFETKASPMVISGAIGPRGDGYDPGTLMSPDEAEAYHARQVGVFAATDADMVTAFTLTNAPEAIGIARAARAAAIPAVISFTLETDGRLPTGQPLGEAIQEVDAATVGGPAYYMINCAHPTHFEDALEAGQPWLSRLRGIRANASMLSHAELDECTTLDAGDPADLGRRYGRLRSRLAHVNVVGGCCGTDHRHIEEIGDVYGKAA